MKHITDMIDRRERAEDRDWDVNTPKLTLQAAASGLLALVPMTIFLASPPLPRARAVPLPSMLVSMVQGNGLDRAYAQLMGWTLYLAIGAGVAVLFSWLVARRRPTSGALAGAGFSIAAWGIVQAVFFPLMGLGLFGLRSGYGTMPALVTLGAFLLYGAVMGLILRAFVRVSAIPRVHVRAAA